MKDQGVPDRGRSQILNSWLKRIRLIAGLNSGVDFEATVVRIRSGVVLRGANLWILLCATIIASIGLNTSSAAVIIGGMLISPLMGPILGIGLGIAIHDRVMLLRALKTFGGAVLLSLVISIVYFWMTPITFPTPELLARTSPTVLDVGIAFFGGVAGIVAGSRREMTTAIPGVAIATALMPPLCTAGYGLANGNWAFFWGALYLFSLNTVFISLATFLIVRLLGIPFVTYVDPAVERRVVRWIFVIVIVATVPSVVLFYRVISDIRSRSAAEQFVRKDLEVNGRKALSWSLEPSDSGRVLKVYLAGTPIPAKGIDSLSKRMVDFGLDDSQLKIVQLNLPAQTGTQIDPQQLLTALKSAELREELAQNIITPPDKHDAAADTIPITRIRSEMLTIFPTLTKFGYAQQSYSIKDSTRDTTMPVRLFLVTQEPTSSRRIRRETLARIQSVLSIRLKPDSVRVLEVIDTVQVTTSVGVR